VSDAPIRVLVVDDHELVRTGLRGVLGGDPDIEVVAEASDGAQALAAVEVHHPDVVVMDLQMPGMGGVEATGRIRALRPGTAVLVLTMFDDDDSMFAAIQAGARGYLLKGARREELRAAVIGVAAGQAVFGPGVAARVLDQMSGLSETPDAFPSLTPREQQVLEHLVAGLDPVAIAPRMSVAEKTVRNTISSVLTKLHVVDRAAAIERARAAGWGGRRAAEVRTMVFTEIHRSTALARQLGTAYPTVLADHNRIVDAAMSRRGGIRFGAAGDSRFGWFPDSVGAITAALEAQRDLAAHNFSTGVEVCIRAGVHRGAVTDDGDDVLGLAVHEVARVGAAGIGGQVICTEAALPDDPPATMRFVDLGEQELRDLDRPLRLFLVESFH
jgi:DNA-binding NarL/FixJ family response regulator